MTERAGLISTEKIAANGVDINVARAGAGPALLLLHGFPHTWEVWSRVIPLFAATHQVIAPDLRGTGGSTRAEGGYDLDSLSADAIGLLDALGIEKAAVIGMDIGASVAFYVALQHPDRVQRLVVMEGILGDLPRPGATSLSPWWFGFHAIPGFAEHVVEGHEEEYIGFFLDHGLVGDGLTPELRTRFIDSYRGSESLRCAFEFYRAFGVDAEQINRALGQRRLTVPTLAVGSQPIGDALHGQLQAVADDLAGDVIDNCGHVIPLDQPGRLAAIVHRFLRRS